MLICYFYSLATNPKRISIRSVWIGSWARRSERTRAAGSETTTMRLTPRNGGIDHYHWIREGKHIKRYMFEFLILDILLIFKGFLDIEFTE